MKETHKIQRERYYSKKIFFVSSGSYLLPSENIFTSSSQSKQEVCVDEVRARKEIYNLSDFGLTNRSGNELGDIIARSTSLTFRPAYHRDLTRLLSCRNHPRALSDKAPLVTGRNKRNKRTSGVCVTLLDVYAGACKQARDGCAA